MSNLLFAISGPASLTVGFIPEAFSFHLVGVRFASTPYYIDYFFFEKDFLLEIAGVEPVTL